MGINKTINIQVSRLSSPLPAGVRIALDSPCNEAVVLAKSCALRVSGWVLSDGGVVPRIVVRSGGDESFYSASVRRPDVVSALGLDAEAENCGFLFALDRAVSFVLCVELGGEVYPAFSVNVSSQIKVLRGHRGHLFLDNDTNNSVDQYVGQCLMSTEVLASWARYFDFLSECEGKYSNKIRFLIAPTKEYVFDDLYPHLRGLETPVDQFVGALLKSGKVVYPLNELRSERELTYWRLDTHWTDYGAGIAARLCMREFGFEINQDPFVYKFKMSSGDLGGKVYPEEKQSIPRADFSVLSTCLQFDNMFPNRGAVKVYVNKASDVDACLVVFGDSYSANMVPHFVQCFRRVVHVDSAGKVDESVLCHERPDYVLAQSNSRFLIVPPPIDYSLTDDYRRKIDVFHSSGFLDVSIGRRLDIKPEYCFYLNGLECVAKDVGLI